MAIVLQRAAAIVIACSGTYGEILNFEVTVDFIFFAMTAAALFTLLRRQIGSDRAVYRSPGHPFTTAIFVLSCAGIVLSALIASPRNSAIALHHAGSARVLLLWSRFRRAHSKFKTAQASISTNFDPRHWPLSPLSLTQGERTEVRGLGIFKATLTRPLSLEGRGDPIHLPD